MNISATPPRLISVRRAAWLIGGKKSAIWHAILAGHLRTVMVGDKHRIIYADLESFISNLGGEPLENILRDIKGDG